jgi:hypothetical protein
MLAARKEEKMNALVVYRQSNGLYGNCGSYTQLGPLRACNRPLALAPFHRPSGDMVGPGRSTALPAGQGILKEEVRLHQT